MLKKLWYIYYLSVIVLIFFILNNFNMLIIMLQNAINVWLNKVDYTDQL